MASKGFRLLVRDVVFFLRGEADVRPAAWSADEWLYPIDWSFQLEREGDYFEPKDAAGLPLRDFRGTLGPQYLISRIAVYALAHWNGWRTSGAPGHRAAFLRVVDAFPEALNGRYEHHFPLAGMRPPWISCISQGAAASVFCRAFVETGERRYLESAGAALEPLLQPVEAGGLLSTLPDGRAFLEEYPGTRYRHVLNGCLYAAVGIRDAILAFPGGDPRYPELLRGLLESLARNIEAWDMHGWSTYDYPLTTDCPRNANTMTYHVLQATLLLYLAESCGDVRLRMAGTRWLHSARRLDRRLIALSRKLHYRLMARW